MRLRKPTKEKTPRLNIPVELQRFIEKDGETGVIGKNLLNGKVETFFLTIPQSEARQKSAVNRPDLSVWSKDSFVEFGQRKSISPGAIFHFKGCMPWKDESKGEHYKSHWVDRLGDNPAQVAECFVNSPAMMVDGQIEMRGKTVADGPDKAYPFLTAGKICHFETDPKMFICHQGAPNNDLFYKVSAADAKNASTSFLIRYMDTEGIAYDGFESKSWINQTERRASNDVAQVILDEIKSTMSKLPSVQGVNIIPVAVYTISNKAIKANGAAFAKAHLCCTSTDAQGYEVKNTQHFFCKTGMAPNQNFINKLDCVDPDFKNRSDPAKNPTTIGGLSFSPAYDANYTFMTGEESHSLAQGNPYPEHKTTLDPGQSQGTPPQEYQQSAPDSRQTQGTPTQAPDDSFDTNDPFANLGNQLEELEELEGGFNGPGMNG